MRFGMFIHWGLYAIPARGEWVMSNEKMSVSQYKNTLMSLTRLILMQNAGHRFAGRRE